MQQLHYCTVWEPINVNKLTPQELKKSLDSLIFLTEKRDRKIKACTCANGSTQRPYTLKEESTSPTTMTESLLLTSVIDAEENCDVMTLDIPNAFVQTQMPEADVGKRVIMKIKGPLIDMLIEMDPVKYKKQYVVHDSKGEKVLYVVLLKALYGMMQSSMLFYKKLVSDLKTIGFELNPYDPCIANRSVNSKQHTILWHVDNVKASHVDWKVNDEFAKWCKMKYGDGKNPVKVLRGKKHYYLAMILDFETTPGAVVVDMKYYVESMVKEFPEQLNVYKGLYPWNESLVKVDNKSELLDKQKSEWFYTFVYKALFLAKRAQPDVLPAIAFLCTHVQSPTMSDWNKFKHMMSFLKCTKDDVLTLQADGTKILKWHVDASFTVHKDMMSHTGSVFSMGKGAINSISTKQKINTRSSTKAELVAIDDVISKIMWTKLFLEAQGYGVKETLIY
mmetsp:Transcript_11837/g.17121  ORF Transcript_11837/g.17121 Transcript_11837/m.17121 type:complete len:448 (-) Transcript_11837:440-1783(-)